MLTPSSLTRHAVCVGMTGSGKTGLCVALLEDLAAQGVPLIAVDPKGDLTNLALMFPTLEAAAFAPWVDPGEATRLGLTVEELAHRTASDWREGLAASGLGSADVASWVAKVDVQVLTPGSDAGRPINILATLTQAPKGLDPEGLRGWVTGAVSALLSLVGLPSDPLTDPGAILLATLFGDAFSLGEDLPLDVLLGRIVDPPFDRLGYFPLDEVMPPKARTNLALALNNVLASPAFAAWRTGERLDLDAWTTPVDGRTPVRVLYLSHLSDAERMFFVSLLAHATVAWTRRQPGTGQLRALLYLDEVFGYLPPHPKDPPSKLPLLTLLKQARSVGLGVMLVTQNPVDLDYKALSNAGTWLVGRLQTENDRERVLEGLVSAGPGPSREELDRRLGALPPRSFVVRDPQGQVREVRSRHTRCYLRGPLTRHEVVRLFPGEGRSEGVGEALLGGPPPVPAGTRVQWAWTGEIDARTVWVPWLWVGLKVRWAGFRDEPVRGVQVLVPLDPSGGEVVDGQAVARAEVAPAGGRYPLLPVRADEAGELARWAERAATARAAQELCTRWRHERLGLKSAPGESAEAFGARVADRNGGVGGELAVSEAGLATVVAWGLVWRAG